MPERMEEEMSAEINLDEAVFIEGFNETGVDQIDPDALSSASADLSTNDSI